MIKIDASTGKTQYEEVRKLMEMAQEATKIIDKQLEKATELIYEMR